MAYLDTRRGPSYGSMAAVVAIHGAIGAALVLGLTVTGVIPTPDLPIPSFDFKKPPPPPEPPKTDDPLPKPVERDIVAPLPPLPIPKPGPTLDTTPYIPPPLPPIPQPGNGDALKATPKPMPSFPPVGAKPRNDPQRWVTTDDYRGNWIRQEMMGKARFRLDIAADGRVTNCTITGSSGHPELDAATCALVGKRARFQPARGSEGEPVAGSYANAIDWQLPE